jgi:hypothetical protein
MRVRFLLLTCLLALLALPALAQQAIPRLSTGGPQLIPGDTVNALIDRLSGSGTAANPTSCTLTAAAPGTVTCNGYRGNITTTVLTAGATSITTYTINNSFAAATSVLSCDLQAYSGVFFTNGQPQIGTCAPGAGTITLTIVNPHATQALNGTIQIGFLLTN